MRPPPQVFSDPSDLEQRTGLAGPEGRPVKEYECDGCGAGFCGEPAGSGLFIWARGGEIRYEEPPLCEECASKVTLGALQSFADEDEDEG